MSIQVASKRLQTDKIIYASLSSLANRDNRCGVLEALATPGFG